MRPASRPRLAILLGLLAATLAWALVARRSSDEAEHAGVSDDVLRSLPYLAWVSTDAPDKRGVTLHDAERAYPGYNLYSPRESHHAVLVDMRGEVRHRWDAAIEEQDAWQIVEPIGAGELLVVVPNRYLLRIDRDSNILWRLDHRVHHDVAVGAAGEIYVLGREEREVERSGRRLPVLDDVLLELTPDGEIRGRLSIHDLFSGYVAAAQWVLLERWLDAATASAEMEENARTTGYRLENGKPPDLYHTNSVEILERELPGVAPAGALLVSIRELSLVAIIDIEAERVAWAWGPGILRRQHHPSLLADGGILVFDNLGGPGGRSRVLEIDPASDEIRWQYSGQPPEAFFSALRGGCQRLPNGNTLITESDRGRVFEITGAGDIVWEYYNPVLRDGGRERSAIYRMRRLLPPETGWLDGAGGQLAGGSRDRD